MTPAGSSAMSAKTLTDWQLVGLNNTFNLADGHAHHQPHAAAVRAVAPRLSSMLFDIEGLPQELFERGFTSVFYELANQSLPPDAELAFHYSASVSTECAARALVDIGVRRVGLVTPTFDNIPLLLRRAGLELVPLEEARFWEDARYRSAQLRHCDCVFLVVPNNPTGFEPDEATFLEAVGAIADRELALAVDFSFRFYSRLQQWDQYKAIAGSWPALNAIFLEDTGKTWPTAELKVGFSCALGALREPQRKATREVLLNVSPFTLRVLTELIGADLSERRGTLADPHSCRVIAENRRELRRLLDGVNVAVDAPDSLVSVEWLRLPEDTVAAVTCSWLEEQKVSVLPGDCFYWDRPSGDRYMRVALARSPAYFKEAAARLAELLEVWLS
jgi:aspartate/methionine/tyrosine aminotransferase